MRLPHVIILAIAATAQAQWQLQQSHTTASLRGIHALGQGVAWASGTEGTVLRTTDDGATWQPCAIPPGAEHLDFRGIQAFDAQTAIVMSSGKGDLSRLYKTTDACQTWKLVFTNPDKEGFWDSLNANSHNGFLVGDPVNSRFQIYASQDGQLETWTKFGEKSSLDTFRFDLSPYDGESLFAASNSVLDGDPSQDITFVTGGKLGAKCASAAWQQKGYLGYPTYVSFKSPIPLAKGESSGAFSLAEKSTSAPLSRRYLIAVGGDYKKPDASDGTAAWSKDGGVHWRSSQTPPHGYRSAVAYFPTHKAWITVGPNGTDLSSDDGRTWRPLRPTSPDADPEEDQHWNALSLPFVVGPKGRIGKLRPEAIPASLSH